MNNFNNWLDTFIDEKNINKNDTFEINKNGTLNIISYGSIIDHIKITSKQEQEQIKKTIVKIDFFNGDVLHFFRHLGQALAKEL
jgi:hypothetical protein|tara:strand:+ start:248 stop:499 length:252 start_codon:yes stop_codon:yes gene_type:complete